MPRSARPFRVVAAVAAVAMMLGGCTGEISAATARRRGWDPRLYPVVRRVESLRHLRFKQPVSTEFLTVAAFRKRVTSDSSKLTPRDRRELQVGEAELRSLGLVDGSFDLLQATDEVNGASVLAYYDPDDKAIVVRGKRLDPEALVTLAHELTHALQDQHYNLNRLQDRAKTSGADDAIVGLIEGDATRIETEYYFGLSARQQRAVDRAERAHGGSGPTSPDAPNPANEAASGIIGASLSSPYAFGPQMVEIILSAKDREGISAAFHRPPDTQLQLLVPTRALAVAKLPPVQRPKLRAGARRLAGDEPDDFGALDLYFLLSSRLPPAVALRAADAWGNGKELISRAKQRTCVDVAFVGRDREGSERLSGALRLWAAAMPPAAITVSADGLTIRGCDPGKSAVDPPNPAEPALTFAAVRSFFLLDLVAGGAPGPVAGCLGDRIVERPGFSGVVAASTEQREPTKSEVDAVTAEIEALIPGCS